MRLARLLCILALLALTATTALAQRGKISGVVTDAGTGDTMPGVNVAIVGTTQGAGALTVTSKEACPPFWNRFLSDDKRSAPT